ncbi:MAG: transporter substrate-binding domain-containing protein [Pseudomonas sp.]|nr:transporter substrate-binding domain-containing protein [Pseudomonas sp.]
MSPHTRSSIRPLVGLIVTLAVSNLQAEEPVRTLNAAFLNYPPMAYLDANGTAAGSVIELTNRVAAESGLQIKWKLYPIRRIYKGLSTGEIDFWPGSQAVPALSEFTYDTPTIGIDITLCAFSLGNAPTITAPQDLSHHRLVLIRGYTYRTQLDRIFAESEHKPIVAPDHEAALELLTMGRADYLVSYNDPIGQVLRDNPLTGSRCDLLDTWPLVYVVSKHIPDSQRVLAALTEGLDRVSASTPRPEPSDAIEQSLVGRETAGKEMAQQDKSAE